MTHPSKEFTMDGPFPTDDKEIEAEKAISRPEQVANQSESLWDVLSHIQDTVSEVYRCSAAVTCLTAMPQGWAAGLKSGKIVLLKGNTTVEVTGRQHKGQVNSIVTGNREAFLVSSGDISVRIWDIERGGEVAALEGHSKWVQCVASTSQYLFSASFDSTIRVYRAEDYGLETVLEGHQGEVACLLAYEQGDIVASGSWDCLIKVWSLTTLKEICTFVGHTKAVDCLALLKGKKLLVSGASDGLIKVWSLASCSEIATLTGHQKGVLCLSMSLSEQFFLSASYDHSLKAWNSASFTETSSVFIKEDYPRTVLLSPNDRYVFTTCDCTIQVYTVDKLLLVAAIQGHTKPVFLLSLSKDGLKLASAGRDNSIRVWTIDYQGIAVKTRGHPTPVTAFAETEEGLATITGKVIRLWSAATQREICLLQGHTKNIECIGRSQNGELLASGGKDKTVIIWNLVERRAVATFTGHTETVCAVAVSQDGKFAVSSSLRIIIVWSLTDLSQVSTLTGHTAEVKVLAITPDSKTVISSSKDETIRFWSLEDFSELWSFTTWARCISISPNGKYMVTGSRDKNVFLWEIETRTVVANMAGHMDGIWSLAISPDSRFAASGSVDATVRLWSLEEQREVACFRHHSQHVTCVTFTRDGCSLISSSWDKSVAYMDISQYVHQTDMLSPPRLVSALFTANINNLRFDQPIHNDIQIYRIAKYNFNCLHICAYFNKASACVNYLKAGTLMLRGAFGSPLTVALDRSSNRCFDALLEYFSSGPETDENWLQMAVISEDLPRVLARNSPFVVPFFTHLFCQSAQPFLPRFITPLRPLPLTDFRSTRQFNIRQIAQYQGREMVKTSNLRVEFWISQLRWNFAPGSSSSLLFLNALKASNHYTQLLSTPFLETLLHAKWNALFPLALAMTFLYTLMMLDLIALVFLYWRVDVLAAFFFVLNCLLLGYELLQVVGGRRAYLSDLWNSIDLLRGVLSLIWTCCLFADINPAYLRLIVVFLCFLRGFTYFRTFAPMRIFVNIALSVATQIYAFLLLLAYSVFGFGIMASIMSKDENATSSWTSAFNILLGSFDNADFGLTQWVIFVACNLVNVIVMLNLLISIIGDAYDRAQIALAENDRHEMFLVVLEFESILFWRRSSGSATIMTKCKLAAGAAKQEEWSGRVNALQQAFKEEQMALAEKLMGERGPITLLAQKVATLESRLDSIDSKLEQLLQAK